MALKALGVGEDVILFFRHGRACLGHPRGAVNDEFDIGLAGGKRF